MPAAAAVCLAVLCTCELNVVYLWDKIDLSFEETDARAPRDPYVPENNIVHRMKIWNDTMYMVVPRFRRGVPATLYQSHGGAVRPFPLLGLQTPGNCLGVQNAKDIEIDHLGQLWTLDAGRVHDLETADRTCGPKLFVVHAESRTVVRSAFLPDHMYGNDSVLSGVAVDLKTLTAVVADVGPSAPGFIVYSLPTGIYRKFKCRALAAVGDAGAAAGYDEAQLAVSPIDDILYFTTVRSDSLYSIPLSVLGAPAVDDVSHHVNNRGPKADTSTAMALDTAGNLYLAMTRKVIAWNTARHGFHVNELYIQDVRLEWISSFAFDAHGYLWIVSSAFPDYLDGSTAKKIPVKIFKRYSGTTSFALQETASAAAAAATAVNDTAVRPAKSSAAADTAATTERTMLLVRVLALAVLHAAFATDIPRWTTIYVSTRIFNSVRSD